MLATASLQTPIGPQMASRPTCASEIRMNSLDVDDPHTSSTSLTVDASARAIPDTDLTNLGWLQKPGVLTSMCTALTGTAQHFSKPGSTRRIRQVKSGETRAENVPPRASRSSDKMVNVILNVRNRKYNGEDARKPPLSFACMIFMAVESSPTKTLPVKDIYDWVMWKFPYYRNAPPGWKNSVRHNLSLNKCFKKVDRYCGKSGNAVSKGGLWTVDPDYRRSLLAALKRSPYHPYHSYFTAPLSPSSSNSSLDSVDPAERDAALTMCMISGGSEGSVSDLLHAVIHDHCYTKCPLLPPSPPPSPLPQVTVKLRTSGRIAKKTGSLTLDEIAAAAELILAQDSEDKEIVSGSESSDEGFGGEVESDIEDDRMEAEASVDLGDSGFRASTSPVAVETSSALDEMGADALLCLATGN